MSSRDDEAFAAESSGSLGDDAVSFLEGERIAREIAGETGPPQEPPPFQRALAVALGAAGERFAGRGILLSTLRITEGSAVVRATPAVSGDSEAGSCPLTRGLLETLPRLVLGAECVVIEAKCALQGERSCVFNVLWQLPEDGGAPAPPPAVRQPAPPPAPPAKELEVRPLSLHVISDMSRLEAAAGDQLEFPLGGEASSAEGSALKVLEKEEEPEAASPESTPATRDGGLSRRSQLERRLPWLGRRAPAIAVLLLVGILGGLGVTVMASQGPEQALAPYGALAGSISGLFFAFLLVVALERVDPRADSAVDVSSLCACFAAEVPEEMTLDELAGAFSRAPEDGRPLVLVPVSAASTEAAEVVKGCLEEAWSGGGGGHLRAVVVAAPGGPADELPEGPSVLLAPFGSAHCDLRAASERLRAAGRAPVLAVVCSLSRPRFALPRPSRH